MVCTNAFGNFVPSFVILKGKLFYSEISEGFSSGKNCCGRLCVAECRSLHTVATNINKLTVS